jgi:hypothetical protein
MTKKPFILLILILALILAGCIKETYDMNKFSDKMKLSPTWAMFAATGDVKLSDRVKESDTIIYNDDKTITIIIRKDSVIDFKLKDYYDLSDMVSFSKGYKIGELKLDDFQGSIPIKLSTILPALVNGSFVNILPFGTKDLGNNDFSPFPNFKNAIFSSGTLEISVTNNLPVNLYSIKVSLFNKVNLTPIGDQLIIPAVNAGATQSATMDLTGEMVRDSLVAAVVLTGCPGTTTPVLINVNSTVQINIKATNLKVQSGRVKLPVQKINPTDTSDIVSFTPGKSIEIEKLKVKTGGIGYTLTSNSGVRGSITFTLPTATNSSGDPLKEIIAIDGTNTPRTISLVGREIDLSTDPVQRYNKIPVYYSITVNPTAGFIDFKNNDSIHIDISMADPDIDYIKGYFGKDSSQIDTDIIDTGLDDFLKYVTGDLHISNPLIKLNYSNSFGIPINVTLNATGKRKTKPDVSLGLLPFRISYPTSITTRDITSSFSINKLNSRIADLISLPPSEITFSGAAIMNPAVAVDGKTNYIFGDSRFLGNIEVSVPMELWIKNLQFSDTLDNFLKPKNDSSSSFKPEDMDYLQIKIVANNGFPLGAALKMQLYDSVKGDTIKTINAKEIILPAPIGSNGIANGKTESTTTIDFDKDFFSHINSADKIIFTFTLNTSENGTKDVKICFDYSISFRASVIVRPNLKL